MEYKPACTYLFGVSDIFRRSCPVSCRKFLLTTRRLVRSPPRVYPALATTNVCRRFTKFVYTQNKQPSFVRKTLTLEKKNL